MVQFSLINIILQFYNLLTFGAVNLVITYHYQLNILTVSKLRTASDRQVLVQKVQKTVSM